MAEERLVRILKIVKRVQAGRLDEPGKLAEEFNVSRRTIFRDLKALQKAGLSSQLVAASKSPTRTRSRGLAQVSLSHQESLSIMLLLRHASSVASSYGEEGATLSAIGKIAELLPDSVVQVSRPLLQYVDFVPSKPRTAPDRENWLGFFQRTMAAHLKVKIEYGPERTDESWTQTVRPQRLVMLGNVWHVLVETDKSRKRMLLPLAAIRTAKVLSASYAIDRVVSEDELWALADGTDLSDDSVSRVKVVFDSNRASQVYAWQWNEDQSATILSDRRLLLEFETQNLDLAMRWLMTFGDGFEVIEPASLRSRIQSVTASLLQKNQL